MSWGGFDKFKTLERPLESQAFEAPCLECGGWRLFQRAHGRFCSNTCRSAWWRREHPGYNAPRIAPEFEYGPGAFAE